MDWAKKFLPVTTIVFLLVAGYMFFVGETSLVSRIQYERTIDSLKIVLENQRDTMLYYQRLNESLINDPETMEHIVREQYNMKRENEDVFIFE